MELNEFNVLRVGASWLLIELKELKVVKEGARWLLRAERKGGKGGGPEPGWGQGGGLTGCCGKEIAGFSGGERECRLRPNWLGGNCPAGGEGGGDPGGSTFTFSAPNIPFPSIPVAFPMIVSIENFEMSPLGRSGVCSSGSIAGGSFGFWEAGGEKEALMAGWL